MEQLNSSQLLALYFDYVGYRDSVKKPIPVSEYYKKNKDAYRE